MTISVKCGQCAQAYEIDQAKYGGKKIKCKKCATVIEVPLEGAVDDFEVVEEQPKSGTEATALPASNDVLSRSRIVGLKSAVALSQLQREEESRGAIRASVLATHGDDKKRQAWRKGHQSHVSTAQSDLKKDEDRIQAFRAFLATQGGTGGYFKAFSTEFKAMYNDAVTLLGAPVRPMPPGTDFGSRAMGLVTDAVLGIYTGRGLLWGKDQMAEKNKAIEEANKIALETIQAAANQLEAGLPAKREALATATHKRDDAFRLREEKDSTDLQTLDQLIVDGKYADATNLATQLLKRVPESEVGGVLVSLSRSAFLSGNHADAARLMQDAICFGMPAPGGMDATYNDLWTKAESGLPGEANDAASDGSDAADQAWVIVVEDWGKKKDRCIEILVNMCPNRPPDCISQISEADFTQIMLVGSSRKHAEEFVEMIEQGGVRGSLRRGLMTPEPGSEYALIELTWKG